MVQDMFKNPSESFGFMLRLENETKYSRMAFCSHEYADTARWPKLVIKYNINDKLSTFYYHSFLLKTDGSLWAWGGNSCGELGDGTTTSRSSQVQIGGYDWKQVSPGNNHSLAIKTDGTLWAWGFNMTGQLGDGTTIEKHDPVKIGTACNWSQISAGYYFSVAIKTNGTLWAWGYNDKGQLGNGTTAAKYAPVQIGTSSKWRMVSARKDYALAIRTDSTLWAWGSNEYGQLGDGTTAEQHAPVQIGTDKDWEVVSAGWDHSLAIKRDGTLWAWGSNKYGQLGDGTENSEFSPVRIDTTSDWKEISAGFEHSMAIKNDGTLWTWGYNYYGQLGDGTHGNAILTPSLIAEDTNCVQVAAGWSYSLILKPDGQYCGSGMNNLGQLGDGTMVNTSTFNCVSYVSDIKSTAAHESVAESISEQSDKQKSGLSQNYPNPSRGVTTIDCYVSEYDADATIVVYNMLNGEVKKCPVENKGNSSVQLDMQDLPSGIYYYGLMINGTIVDEKKMVVFK
jgi:alpha-tubulin suppressor-like RCC1 family protein